MPCSAEDAARLIEACRELISGLDVESVLERAARLARGLLGAEAARVLLLDEESGELVCEGVNAEDGNAPGAGVRLPPGEGLTGWVFSEGRARIFNEPAKEKGYHAACDGVEGLRLRSLMIAPLTVHEKTIGAASAQSSRKGAFGAGHLELFTRFAGLAAEAIHSAHLHRREIEVERARHELALAAEIQKSLFPTELPDTGDFEFEAVCLPAEEVGGDLYDVFPFPDGRFCAVLGDVSGKGVPAALHMVQLVAELRILAEGAPGLPELLGELNRRLAARSTRGVFVTLLAGLFSKEGGGIEVASAGHHPPLLRRAGGGVEEIPYPSAPPLGINPEQVYPTARVVLAPGEAALGFTDGVVEARNGADEEFGLERLKAALAEGSGPGTLRRILKHLARFTNGAPQRDDTTMVLMWRKG